MATGAAEVSRMGVQRQRKAGPIAWALLLGACGGGDQNPFEAASDTTSTDTTPGATSVAATTSTSSTGTSVDDSGGEIKLDVLPSTDVPGTDYECTQAAPADIDPRGAVPCNDSAPPDSFDPEVQWTWDGGQSYHTPLVINLTDDNGNGQIDVCDIPDVILSVGTFTATLHILDGATGTEHFQISGAIDAVTTPAVGDIDGDGLPEIVAAGGTPFASTLIAYEHDGTPKWTSDTPFIPQSGSAIGIANFDNEGPAEVYVAGIVVRGDTGEGIFTAPPQAGLLAAAVTAPIAADLDGDGDLEFIRGQDAYHLNGKPVYADPNISPGFPQIANLDDDDDPEILVISTQGITVLEHDGTPKYQNVRPTGDPPGFSWFRPATVHDFDADGIAEYAVSSASHYAAYRADYAVMWIADVQDPSGIAAGTAFDFLGDGSAEAMYADEYHLFAFDVDGTPIMEVDRSSGTLIEYPIVVDVDNDGAAEVLVVSNENFEGQQLSPTLQVIRDSGDRWIQARRIWNQHTYHVTNVNEDGTIPDVEPPSWQLLNTYRTNAQIEGGTVCVPPVG